MPQVVYVDDENVVRITESGPQGPPGTPGTSGQGAARSGFYTLGQGDRSSEITYEWTGEGEEALPTGKVTVSLDAGVESGADTIGVIIPPFYPVSEIEFLLTLPPQTTPPFDIFVVLPTDERIDEIAFTGNIGHVGVPPSPYTPFTPFMGLIRLRSFEYTEGLFEWWYDSHPKIGDQGVYSFRAGDSFGSVSDGVLPLNFHGSDMDLSRMPEIHTVKVRTLPDSITEIDVTPPDGDHRGPLTVIAQVERSALNNGHVTLVYSDLDGEVIVGPGQSVSMVFVPGELEGSMIPLQRLGGGGSTDTSGFVPETRSINDKPLTSDIELDFSDVGADEEGAATAAIAYAIQRVHHEGTQSLSTISDAGDAAGKDVGTGAGDVAVGTTLASAEAFATAADATLRSEIIGTAPSSGDTLGELHARLAVVEALGSLATDAELIAAIAAILGTADSAGDTLGELEALISARLLKTNNLSDLTNFAAARTNIGLAIGSDVQAYSAKLAAMVALTWAADKVMYLTGTGTVATADFASFARGLLALTDSAAMRAYLATDPETMFGTGEDGDVTFNVNTTITSNIVNGYKNYRNITIAAGVTVTINGGKIFASGTVTAGAGAKISADGGNASGTVGGTGASGPYPAPTLSNNGGNGSSTTSSTAGNPTANPSTGTGFIGGGAGGAGGAGSTGAGGVSGVAWAGVTWTEAGFLSDWSTWSVGFVPSRNAISNGITGAGRGGGGGSGDSANLGRGGGGGGGYLVCMFRRTSGALVISAKGGNGAAASAGNVGGGGGGGGGFATLWTGDRTTLFTLDVSAGTGGAGNGTGTAGTNGSVGNAKLILGV